MSARAPAISSVGYTLSDLPILDLVPNLAELNARERFLISRPLKYPKEHSYLATHWRAPKQQQMQLHEWYSTAAPSEGSVSGVFIEWCRKNPALLIEPAQIRTMWVRVEINGHTYEVYARADNNYKREQPLRVYVPVTTRMVFTATPLCLFA